MELKGEGQLCRVGNGVDGPPQSSAVSDGLGFDALRAQSIHQAVVRADTGGADQRVTGDGFYRDIALSVRALQCDRAVFGPVVGEMSQFLCADMEDAAPA